MLACSFGSDPARYTRLPVIQPSSYFHYPSTFPVPLTPYRNASSPSLSHFRCSPYPLARICCRSTSILILCHLLSLLLLLLLLFRLFRMILLLPNFYETILLRFPCPFLPSHTPFLFALCSSFPHLLLGTPCFCHFQHVFHRDTFSLLFLFVCFFVSRLHLYFLISHVRFSRNNSVSFLSFLNGFPHVFYISCRLCSIVRFLLSFSISAVA